MIDLDHNAGTPVLPEVLELLVRELADAEAGNPSSLHRRGQRARARLDDARARLARALGADAKEVVLVGSGTEADALALKGVFFGRQDKSRVRLVSSSQEHPAILFALEQLKGHGAEVVLVSPDTHGVVTLAALEPHLDPTRTLLCSLQWANNETGVLQPVEAVAQRCREKGILFHTDAVQAVGKVPVDFHALGADFLSLSGHKLGAPAGVGALLVRRGLTLESLLAGHQESGRRGGTPSVAFAAALALALELSVQRLPTYNERVGRLRDDLEAGLLDLVPNLKRNGDGMRVPNTTNLGFTGVDGEALLIALDLAGIAAASGAACASGSAKASHVLLAMGRTEAEARSSLRFSLGWSTTRAQVDETLAAVGAALLRMGGHSPSMEASPILNGDAVLNGRGD